jgi:hypothetical protein
MRVTQLQWKGEVGDKVLIQHEVGEDTATLPPYRLTAADLRSLIRAGQECLEIIEGRPPEAAAKGGAA